MPVSPRELDVQLVGLGLGAFCWPHDFAQFTVHEPVAGCERFAFPSVVHLLAYAEAARERRRRRAAQEMGAAGVDVLVPREQHG